MAIIVIDNYDSFTYNLVQYLGELTGDVRVFRNNQTTPGEIRAMQPDAVVISPGPCTPHEAGISAPLVAELAGQVPVLGVCLGQQRIGAAFRGKLVPAPARVHGHCTQ